MQNINKIIVLFNMRSYENVIAEKKIHFIDWFIPDPKAVILIVHGYAEHSARYSHVADFFNKNGFSVQAFDFTGHGKSEGLRGYISDFNIYVNELEFATNKLAEDFPSTPIFVLSHSMGGTVAGIAAAKNKMGGVKNLILSNPGLDIVTLQPAILVSIVRLLAPIAPKMKTSKLSSEFISKDPKEREKYDTDPLNYRQGARPGFANEFDKAGAWLRNNADKITQNIYLNYSLTDKVVNPKASEVFFEKLSSHDKSKTEYPGLYHELLNEPEKEVVMSNMLTWCIERINKDDSMSIESSSLEDN